MAASESTALRAGRQAEAMGRPSTINRLPGNVREALHGRLNDPGITQEEATLRTNALLAEIVPEHPRVSY